MSEKNKTTAKDETAALCAEIQRLREKLFEAELYTLVLNPYEDDLYTYENDFGELKAFADFGERPSWMTSEEDAS